MLLDAVLHEPCIRQVHVSTCYYGRPFSGLCIQK